MAESLQHAEPAGHQSGFPLSARLFVQPAGTCPVVESADSTATLSRHTSRDRTGSDEDSCSGTCHAELSPIDGCDESEYRVTQVTSSCVCPVFDTVDGIPDIRTVENGGFVVSLVVQHRNALQELIADLQSVGATVSLEQLVPRTNDDVSRVDGIDAEVTEKQREALEMAVSSGYYETPRETDLEELAERLSVSRSAVSQRLNAVEAKLVRSFCGGSRS